MQKTVMLATERHSELVTGFKAHGSWLCECQMVGVARRFAAEQKRLGGNILKVALVSQSLRSSEWMSV